MNEPEQIKEEIKKQQKVFNRKRNKLIKAVEETREKLINYSYCKDGNTNYLNDQIRIIKNIAHSKLTSIIADLCTL